MKSFIKFIREQGIIGLAVGFIMGGTVSKVVSSLVTDIIQPLIGAMLGSTKSLSSMSFHIRTIEIRMGNFLAILIDFIIISAVVFFIFKGLKLDKLDKKK